MSADYDSSTGSNAAIGVLAGLLVLVGSLAVYFFFLSRRFAAQLKQARASQKDDIEEAPTDIEMEFSSLYASTKKEVKETVGAEYASVLIVAS